MNYPILVRFLVSSNPTSHEGIKRFFDVCEHVFNCVTFAHVFSAELETQNEGPGLRAEHKTAVAYVVQIEVVSQRVDHNKVLSDNHDPHLLPVNDQNGMIKSVVDGVPHIRICPIGVDRAEIHP